LRLVKCGAVILIAAHEELNATIYTYIIVRKLPLICAYEA
jgi:hypothetical protein